MQCSTKLIQFKRNNLFDTLLFKLNVNMHVVQQSQDGDFVLYVHSPLCKKDVSLANSAGRNRIQEKGEMSMFNAGLEEIKNSAWRPKETKNCIGFIKRENFLPHVQSLGELTSNFPACPNQGLSIIPNGESVPNIILIFGAF